MTVTFPEAVTSQGRRKVVILTTAPAAPAAITVAAAGAGIESSMYLIGQFAPSGSQNKGNGPRRVAERAQLQRLGDATYESPSLAYVHDPQGGPSDEANVVKTALAVGTEVWIVERVGLDVETAIVAAQKYRLHHLEVGVQWFAPTGDDEFAYEQVVQETGYLTPPIDGVFAA